METVVVFLVSTQKWMPFRALDMRKRMKSFELVGKLNQWIVADTTSLLSLVSVPLLLRKLLWKLIKFLEKSSCWAHLVSPLCRVDVNRVPDSWQLKKEEGARLSY